MTRREHPDLYNLPDSLTHDLATLVTMVQQYKAGEISSLRFRAFRVPLGVYEQRELGTYMLRVRLPGGTLLPRQMHRLAQVSQRYGNGVLHVTTRQDIQVHGVVVDDIHPALVSLREAGLSTSGGGGNTVRNVTACYDAGVCSAEAFDVTPYTLALTEHLLADPLSFQLPRKFKIALAGCGRDCSGATIHDVGLIAKQRDGEPGFAVYVGGGMGSGSRVADLLEPFVPANEIHWVVEAVKRVFDKHGNRKNKNKARLRFLLDKIGLEAFRELYEQELVAVRRDQPQPLEIRPLAPSPQIETEPQAVEAEIDQAGLAAWQEANVLPQKQAGYYMVFLPLLLGDIAAEDLSALAHVVERYGEGMLRAEQRQNAVLRWVSEAQLDALYASLAPLGLVESQPPILRDLVSCTGASTCQLGICLSRGLAKAIARELSRSHLDLAALGELSLHISGCPNSCGRHPMAQIGFYGAARRVHGRLAPHYTSVLGGRVAEGETRLAERAGILPARDVPTYVKELLQAYSVSSEFPDFDAFIDNGGGRIASDLLAKYADVPDFDEDKNYYFDWSAEELFSMAGRGPGECSAGVFDLIDADLDSACDALTVGKLFEAAGLASRALLVTRGEQPEDDLQALTLFKKHFAEPELVSAELDKLVSAGIEAAGAPNPAQAFDATPDDVAALIAAVQELYDNMDPSLRFTPVKAQEAEVPEAPAIQADSSHDFRGVVCPLNYVKTKMALAPLQAGQILEVLLDDEGAQNVPDSAARDGHQVLNVERQANHWRVIIRKGGE